MIGQSLHLSYSNTANIEKVAPTRVGHGVNVAQRQAFCDFQDQKKKFLVIAKIHL
jgi:hypothetical protein